MPCSFVCIYSILMYARLVKLHARQTSSWCIIMLICSLVSRIMQQQKFNLKPIISILIFVAIIFVMIIFIGKILTPFIIALILTYILNPVVEKINQKCKINRSIISLIISILVFLIFIAIPIYIIPNVVTEVQSIISKIPNLVDRINNTLLSTINQRYGTHFVLDLANLRTELLNNISNVYSRINIFSPLAKNGVILIQILLYIILIPFILFYSICNWHTIVSFFDRLIPRSYVKTVHEIVKDVDKMLSAYLRGQFSVMIIMAIYYGTALQLIGLTSGFVIGFVTGMLVFIPYLGVFTGFFISLAVAFSNFQGMNQIFAILGILITGHIVEGAFVTPYLVGGKIGLNPVMIILSLMIFGTLFGFVGVLLALPLSTITVVLLKYANSYYTKSKYYNEIS
jgi:predicted PurR-regulated permease PerM